MINEQKYMNKEKKICYSILIKSPWNCFTFDKVRSPDSY